MPQPTRRTRPPLGQRTLGQRTTGQQSPNVQLSQTELQRAAGPGQGPSTTTGRGGALGLLAQNLATGITNRKKRGGAWQKKGQQSQQGNFADSARLMKAGMQRNVSQQALTKRRGQFAQSADLMKANMTQR